MKSEPWARLTRFMMPKTRVSPAAIRNSMTPYCSPFSPCSSTSSTSRSRASAVRPGRRKKAARAAPAPLARRSGWRLPLHPAVLGVGVLVVLEDRLLDLHRELALGRPHSFQEVEVLDREVVHVVLVRTARRLVVGLPHGGDHPRLVREVTLDRAHRGVDQHHAVVALRAVERGRVAVLLPEVGHVLRVRLVAEVRAPVPRLPDADRRLLQRGERHLVDRVDRVERDLLTEPRLGVLLHELDSHRPRIEDEHRLRIRRSEEHTSELQSQSNLVCRLLLEKKKKTRISSSPIEREVTDTY